MTRWRSYILIRVFSLLQLLALIFSASLYSVCISQQKVLSSRAVERNTGSQITITQTVSVSNIHVLFCNLTLFSSYNLMTNISCVCVFFFSFSLSSIVCMFQFSSLLCMLLPMSHVPCSLLIFEVKCEAFLLNISEHVMVSHLYTYTSID